VFIIVANHKFFHSIHQLSRYLTKETNKALQPFGLFSAQWSVIYVLKMKGSLTQRELCDYLSVEAPPLTRNVQRLVKEGYVRQVPGMDKRMKFIELTEKAQEEFPVWEKAVMETNQLLLRNFPMESQEKLEELVSDWLKKSVVFKGE
jgi:DNA-binding MarR family transcriptional regulator